MISGRSEVWWFEHVLQKYVQGKGIRRALDLGCGSGALEQATLPLHFIDQIEAYDLSSEAIEQAVKASKELGFADKVRYHCADFSAGSYQDDEFDLVIISMALHHVLDIEQLLQNLKRWKKSSAPFVAFEYVGPNRFQWTEVQLQHQNRLLASIPPKLRVHGVDGHLVERLERPGLKQMIEGDPSEAIRSADIIGLLGVYFEIIEKKDFGGTILQPLLADIIHNFDPSDPDDAAVLNSLIAEERKLINSGTLESNFSLLVCQ